MYTQHAKTWVTKSERQVNMSPRIHEDLRGSKRGGWSTCLHGSKLHQLLLTPMTWIQDPNLINC